jgi:TonB family protein
VIHVRSGVAICAFLILANCALAQEHVASVAPPNQFEIARRTFFDFGPPFDYYELFFVRPTSTGASIERITLTPPADHCASSAKLEAASGSINESIEKLLGRTNPCSIPEKELRRELKRCKKCLVFSGATVVIQVQCGSQTRLIRADVLDKDMFDPAANTPQHTSWTMTLLERLDHAVGPGVMDKPMFAVVEEEKASGESGDPMVLRDISLGKYDAMFPGAPDKPSDLYRAAQIHPTSPTVSLQRSTPFQPSVSTLPAYPPIARVAHVEGAVSLEINVDSNGNVTDVVFDSGPPLLREAVKNAVIGWKFPEEAFNNEVQVTLEFALNCSARSR